MKKLLTVILVLFVSVSVHAKSELKEKEKAEIMELFTLQVEAWNQGNLEAFMQTYWDSEELVFVGSRGPTYGWQETLDSYKRGYPDKKTMGQLEFKILKISKIDRKTVFVIGRFELTREVGDAAGYFTLVVQKKQGDWKIISDHSSAGN